MLFGALLIIGTGLGAILGALSNPKIYRAVMGGRKRSADHDEADEF
ncbi:MAG: hypothetical protein AAFQ21_13395 [Pseudomonadota bacterium]